MVREIKHVLFLVALVLGLMVAYIGLHGAHEVHATDGPPAASTLLLRQACFYGLLVAKYVSVLTIKLHEVDVVEDLPSWVITVRNSDWVKALPVALAVPLLPVVLIFQKLRNAVRSFRGLRTYMDWDLTSVLTKANTILAVYLFAKFCGGDGLECFVEFLEDALKTTSLPIVTLVMFISGFMLFMFPPTTGQPIYILAGTLFPNKLRGWFNYEKDHTIVWRDGAFIVGILLASLLGLAMKLAAGAAQQECIGRRMSTSLRIRMMCGVHRAPIRATEALLRGDSYIKRSCILMGCPDWPTGVLCGLLKLDLGPVLALTTPIFFFAVLPNVIAGGLVALKKITIAQNTMLMAVVMQLAIFVSALVFVEREAEKPEHSVPREQDAELVELQRTMDREAAMKNEQFRWEKLPFLVKVLHASRLVLFWVSIALEMMAKWHDESEDTPEAQSAVEWLTRTVLRRDDPNKVREALGVCFPIAVGSACGAWLLLWAYDKVVSRRIKANQAQETKEEENEPLLKGLKNDAEEGSAMRAEP